MTESALYYFLQCGCGARIQLPSPMLDKLLGYPVSRSTGTASVALACHRCKQVKVHALKDTAVLFPVTPVYVFSKALECGEKSCRTPLIVVAVRSDGISNEEIEKDAASWKWGDLRCPSGNLIPPGK